MMRKVIKIYKERAKTSILLSSFAMWLTITSILLASNSQAMPDFLWDIFLPLQQIFQKDKFYQPESVLPLNNLPEDEINCNYLFFIDESKSTNDKNAIASIAKEESIRIDQAEELLSDTKGALIGAISKLAYKKISDDMEVIELKHLIAIHQMLSLLKISEGSSVKAKFSLFGFGEDKKMTSFPDKLNWYEVNQHNVSKAITQILEGAPTHDNTDIKKMVEYLDRIMSNINGKSNKSQEIVSIISDFQDTKNYYLKDFEPLVDKLSLYCSEESPLSINLISLPSEDKVHSDKLLSIFRKYIPNKYLKEEKFPFSKNEIKTHLQLKSGLSPVRVLNDQEIKFYFDEDRLSKSNSTIRIKGGLDRSNPQVLITLHDLFRKKSIHSEYSLSYNVVGADNAPSSVISDRGYIHLDYYKIIPLKEHEGLFLTFDNFNGLEPRLALEIFIENDWNRYIVPVTFNKRLLQVQAAVMSIGYLLTMTFFILMVLRICKRVSREYKNNY
ncbi:MAG: hypothetical protein JXR03_21035 [Cyclobacteriaceae bacterium]